MLESHLPRVGGGGTVGLGRIGFLKAAGHQSTSMTGQHHSSKFEGIAKNSGNILATDCPTKKPAIF